jgi:hypothetical protein
MGILVAERLDGTQGIKRALRNLVVRDLAILDQEVQRHNEEFPRCMARLGIPDTYQDDMWVTDVWPLLQGEKRRRHYDDRTYNAGAL